LLCRAGAVLCALPIEYVIEIMRPLPLDVLSGLPHFVGGMAVVRGAPLPVLVLSRLFEKEERRPERLVIVRAGERRVGLAVDAVIGIRALADHVVQTLPPLGRDAFQDAIAAIGTLDNELLLVLQAARLVPAEVFDLIEAKAVAS
jgi:purine-binding chemotaxis protein CheW